MTLEVEGWKIMLDSAREQREAITSLRNCGGHAITYVGRVERSDGTTFGLSELEENLQLLNRFLSFVNGDQCSLVIPVAYDAAGIEVWRGWNPGNDAPWLGKPSWSNQLPADFVSPAFPGYMRRSREADWQEPIALAIDWFLQAKRGTAEGALLLGQSALELLGWVQFVESGSMSIGDYEKQSASERIRRLLLAHRSECTMPKPFEALAAMGFDDGPHAITAIRNGIVHPKKSKRDMVLNTAAKARRQAANLTLYYLECVLLSLFDYNNLNFIPAETLFTNS